ncbi:MAG: hypothetical protein IBJ11_05760 [Phycisphaerales bacterium]|nr:hypothetical protein [Phycisphaerales bacterium]
MVWNPPGTSAEPLLVVGNYEPQYPIGGLSVGKLAAWDGRAWSAFPEPPVSTVGSMLVFDGAIVVADAAPGARRPPYRWTGTEWMAVGPEGYWLDIRLMADWNGTLVAGGTIAESGLGRRHVIARLTENRWEELSGWPSRPVNVLAVHGGMLIAGCEELSILPTPQRPGAVTFWDGSGWRDFGPRTIGTVFSLATFGGRLFVGAAENRLRWGTSEGSAFPSNAAWIVSGDGSDWVPAGVQGLWRPFAYSFHVDGGRLVAAGAFDDPAGSPADTVYGAAEWTGGEWRPFAPLQRSSGGAWFGSLTRFGQDLFALGNFSAVDGLGAANAARFDGSRWRRIADGVWGQALAAAEYRGALVLAGGFRLLHPTGEASGVAVYDDHTWRPLADGEAGAGVFTADGLPGVARDALVIGNELFVAGRFDSAGGVAARNIAAWNGASWRAVGGGLDGTVAFLASLNGTPVAATEVAVGGTVTAYSIRSWNGSAWVALGTAQPPTVSSIAVWNGVLYLGAARRYENDPLAGSGLLRWDGQAWASVPAASGWDVVSISPGSGGLWLAGYGSVGPELGSTVARWDGVTLTPLDAGSISHPPLSPIAAAVAEHRGQVHRAMERAPAAVGDMTTLTRWNGSGWEYAPSPPPVIPVVRPRRMVSIGDRLVLVGAWTGQFPWSARPLTFFRGGGVLLAGFDGAPPGVPCGQSFSIGVRVDGPADGATYRWSRTFIPSGESPPALVLADTDRPTVRVVRALPGRYSLQVDIARACDTASAQISFTVLPLLGDVYPDGDISALDLQLLLASFGARQGDADYTPSADVDGSGAVGASDLTLLLASFGRSCR